MQLSRVMSTLPGTRQMLKTFPDPSRARGGLEHADYLAAYGYRWAFYNSTAFDEIKQWAIYRASNRLYRHTKSFYNPYPLLVDFYAGVIYPGYLPTQPPEADDLDLKMEQAAYQMAIPLSPRTPPEMTKALYRAFQWTRWAIQKNLMIRYGAALGDVLVEVIEDRNTGRAYPLIRWPGFCTEFSTDMAGNLTRYVLKWQFREDNRTYDYMKVVTAESIATFRDGKPHGYDGMPPSWENPYGFVPAVWIKHKDTGGDRGAPAMRNPSVWERLNGAISHLYSRMHQTLAAPALIAGEGVQRLGGTTGKVAETSEYLEDNAGFDESFPFIRASSGATIAEVPMDYKGALDVIEASIRMIEELHPEVLVYRQLRSMERMSGPAAERMFGDVDVHLQDAKAVYDEATGRLFGMYLAIMGEQQRKGLIDAGEPFGSFSAEAYRREEIVFDILPRPLLPLTEQEKLQNELLRQAVRRNEEMGSMAAGPESGFSQRQPGQVQQTNGSEVSRAGNARYGTPKRD